MKFRIGDIVIAALMLFVSCKGTEPQPADFGYDYFPLEVGQVRYYEVDSIFYSRYDVNPIDSVSFTIVETVVDTFSSGGNINYIIERSTHKGNQLISENTFRYYQTILGNRVEEVYDNMRIVKLTFPVTTDASWDMNAFNSENKMEAEIIDVSNADESGLFAVDSNCTVVYFSDTTNFIFKQMWLEKYARGYGMYYREYLIKETQQGKDSGVYVIERLKMLE